MSTTPTTVTGIWSYYDPDSYMGCEPEVVTVTNSPEALAEDLRGWLGGMDPGFELFHQVDAIFLVRGTIEGEPHEFLAKLEPYVKHGLAG